MKPQQQPSKEAVRQWQAERQQAKTPPPKPEEVRRQLGWGMLANNIVYVR
jgi:hypothetical protein